MRRLTQRGGPRRSRRPTTRRCAISSCTCTGCLTPKPPARRRRAARLLSRRMSLLRQFSRSQWTQRASGVLAAHYLRLGWHANRVRIEPPEAIERAVERMPIILTLWHGQHFLTPFVKPKGKRAKVMISRHRDGEINAIAAEHLGI